MEIEDAVQTVLKKNPTGLKAKELIEKVKKITGKARSTIYQHLTSMVNKGEIYTKNNRYYPKKPYSLKHFSQFKEVTAPFWKDIQEAQRLYKGAFTVIPLMQAYKLLQTSCLKLPAPYDHKMVPTWQQINAEREKLPSQDPYSSFKFAFYKKSVIALIRNLSKTLYEWEVELKESAL